MYFMHLLWTKSASLSPCKYRSTAKHSDDSHIKINIICNCGYAFLLFNEKHAYELKKPKGLVFAVSWCFGICIIKWWSGYKLRLSDGLKTAGSRGDLPREGSFCLCPGSSFSKQSSLATIRPMAWPSYSNFMFLCLFVSMNPMRLNETVRKMERYVLPTVKDNDVEVKRS